MDDYIVNGSWHKCVCGSRWSDSDGEPCHFECECGEVVDCTEGFGEDSDMCKACYIAKVIDDVEDCPECGSLLEDGRCTQPAKH